MLTDTHRRVQMIMKGRLNNSQIATFTNCARATVRAWRKRLNESGLNEDEITALSEMELRRIVAPGAFRRKQKMALPDYDKILFEAGERGVRLKTLYKDYCDSLAEGARAMSRTTFYRSVAEMADRKNVILTFEYEPGEMIQADFVGRKTLKQPILVDADGLERAYEIFCAASAKSRKTFVWALENQARIPVLEVMTRMLEFFGGVPVLVTIDNFKAAVAVPRRGGADAIITADFKALADHYGFSFVATRVRKPRDKAIVENAVGITQDDILAPLRNRRFFSLAEMNAAIMDLLRALNDRPMRGHAGASRNELFDRTDYSGYQPLPKAPYEPGRFILRLRAGRDYRITLNGTRYSVPWRFAGDLLNAKVTAASIHLFHAGKCIATHPRRDNCNNAVTSPGHMPAAHRAASLTRLAGMKSYVADIGPHAEKLIDLHFRINRKPALTAKAATSLRALADLYPSARIERACALAIEIGKANVRKVEAILVAGLDVAEPEPDRSETTEARKNIRGADYYTKFLSGAQGGQTDDYSSTDRYSA